MSCEHMNFSATVNVGRITDNHDETKVIAFSADVRVSCADCGEDFIFLCPTSGMLPDRPAVSVDGLEMRLPLAPAGHPDGFRMPFGFSVTATGPAHDA